MSSIPIISIPEPAEPPTTRLQPAPPSIEKPPTSGSETDGVVSETLGEMVPKVESPLEVSAGVVVAALFELTSPLKSEDEALVAVLLLVTLTSTVTDTFTAFVSFVFCDCPDDNELLLEFSLLEFVV